MLNVFFYRVRKFENLKLNSFIKNANLPCVAMDTEQKYSTIKASRETKLLNTKKITNKELKVDLTAFKKENKPKMKRKLSSSKIIENTEQHKDETSSTEKKSRGKNSINLDKYTDLKELRIKIEQNSELVKTMFLKIKNRNKESLSEKITGVTDIPADVLVQKKEETDKKPFFKREHVKMEYESNSQELQDEDFEIPFVKTKYKSIVKSESQFPLNWEIVLNNLREMRKNFDAPVDSMGCDKCFDENAPPKVSYLKYILIMFIYSSPLSSLTL